MHSALQPNVTVKTQEPRQAYRDTVDRCPQRTLSLDRRAAGQACLRYYLASGTTGIMPLTSVFLLLPILRDAGSRGGLFVHYVLPLPTGEALNLSLHWAAPSALLMLASWSLALSKRVEYQLWHTGYAAARSRSAALLPVAPPRARAVKRLDGLARATGMALRLLVLFGFELARSFVPANCAGSPVCLHPRGLRRPGEPRTCVGRAVHRAWSWRTQGTRRWR